MAGQRNALPVAGQGSNPPVAGQGSNPPVAGQGSNPPVAGRADDPPAAGGRVLAGRPGPGGRAVSAPAPRRRRVLAIASGGGHWQQLMALRPAFEGCDVLYATTLPGLPEEFGALPARIVPDCNRHEPVAILRAAAAIGRLVAAQRPDVVVSTGALPGVIALGWGKAWRARTVWIDSIANAEEMSMSGRLARPVADLWLSQWPHVAAAAGAGHAGAVL